MKIYQGIILIAAIIATQCKTAEQDSSLVEYDQEGRQLLTMNELGTNGLKWKTPMVVRESPDSIVLGDQLIASIYINSKDIKIVEAFFDCDSVPPASVDTVSFEVTGCSKKLYIKNDTLLIGLRPSEIGEYDFPEITLLTVDEKRVFRTIKHKFSYKVVGR